MSKIIVITGATDGIGKVSAFEMAKEGHHLILVGRNADKLNHLATELKTYTKNVNTFVSDLSLVSETIAVGKKISESFPKVDVLLNNAGAFFSEYKLTKEELESTFSLNHLNYFVLAMSLIGTLRKSGEGRIVNVASRAHMGMSLDFENLMGEKNYEGWKQYQKSKLMNIYFTYELAERLATENITVNCLHPGFVKTKFGHNNEGLAKFLVNLGQNLFAISEKKGAETSIFLCLDPSLAKVTGKYFVKKKIQSSSDVSYQKDPRQKLWNFTVDLLKQKFRFHSVV